MSFFQNIAQGFEHAAREASKHVNAENVGRGFAELGKNMDNAAREVGKHVNAENIGRGFEEFGKNCHNAAQEVGKHVNAQNIARGAEEVRKGLDFAAQEAGKHINGQNIQHGFEQFGKNCHGAAQEMGKAVNHARPHVEHAAFVAKHAVDEASKHTAKNIAIGANNTLHAISKTVNTLVSASGSPSFSNGSSSGSLVAVEKVIAISSSGPISTTVTGSGILLTVAPILVAAPVILAASSVAGTISSTMGGVVLNGVFSILQGDITGGIVAICLAQLVNQVG
ncbi:hypothetical protein PT974_00316 [Cladobotryum mycophilum]|uniref:Uncharacterized protein n=1 Tax=Cladobotryum mycophilum TaxID=491253 RepID=A0ABR0T0G4_9HYPO